MTKIDYKSAGVNIDAGNRAVELIKQSVKSTFNKNVLTEIGSFGSLFSLKDILSDYSDPVLVQSIDGVGTKTIIARMMNKYDTIGIDLVSACCNDITVMGAQPLTFLDYVANDKMNPEVIKEIVRGMSDACLKNNIALVGGETAEMPDTYLRGEHDLVGVMTGVVERTKIIAGSKIREGDILIGLPSTGLQTNGYSLARKIFFGIGNYNVADMPKGLNKSVGATLLEPSYIYNPFIKILLQNNVIIKGMAHISGGGLIENIPRILPGNCAVDIQLGSWSIPHVFPIMQDIGNVDETEMYRTFNMGIGLVIIASFSEAEKIHSILKGQIDSFTIGNVIQGKPSVILK